MKKCKGTGKATGHGCGKPQEVRIYGLGIECKCYQNWLFNTEAGKQHIKKTTIRAKKKEDKERKMIEKEEKEQFTDWGSKLQDKINEIARLIDLGRPCLARGYHPKQIHAGHIFSRGSSPQMKYNLHNIHRQSAQSNHFQNEDGLLREGLINEYGQEYFNFISGLRNSDSKHTNEELKAIYKRACKIALDLKKSGNTFNLFERIEARNSINIELGIYKVKDCVFVIDT